MKLGQTGKYIAEKRKACNLTQQNLADILNVNSKTVSKWERGINAPDISLLPLLAKNLNTNIESIIFGEDIKRNDEQHNDAIIEFLTYYKEKIQKKMLSIIIAIIMVTFTFFGAVIIYEKLNDYFIYEIKNEIGDFNVNGYLIFNTRKKILNINGLSYNDIYVGTDKEINADKIEVSVLLEDIVLYKEMHSQTNENEVLYFNDLLSLVRIDLNSNEIPKMKEINKKSVKNLKLEIKYNNDSNENIISIDLF